MVLPRAKGTVFLSAALFTERRLGGKDAVRRALTTLPPEAQAALDAVIPIGWYPLQPMLDFHRAVDQLYARGDLALVREIGRFSAEWQLTSFHKLLLRLKDPQWLVKKAGTMWSHYHDSGRWDVDPPQASSLSGRLHDFAIVDAALCLREQGWFERAIELTGGRSPVVRETKCRSRGDDCCEFVGSWS